MGGYKPLRWVCTGNLFIYFEAGTLAFLYKAIPGSKVSSRHRDFSTFSTAALYQLNEHNKANL